MKTITASCLALLLSVPAFGFSQPPNHGGKQLVVGLTVGAVGGGGFVLTPDGVIAY